jgi:hypothetical protein
MSQLVPVKIPPGFFRNGTEYEASGRWYDGNLVRWALGRLRPWGGWLRYDTTQAPFSGVARAIMTWRDNLGFRYTAVGTNTKLYVSGGGAYSDATPAGLVTGRADAIEGNGYSAGPYGAQAYSTARTGVTGILLEAATWTFDLFGQNLMCVLSSDGNLYQLIPGSPPATLVSGAPANNVAVIVTDEQYVVLLGAGGNLRMVKWCDQANPTVWTASATNTAGGLPITTTGTIVTGAKVGNVPLIFTSTDVHALQYEGPPVIYAINRIADNCGVVSAHAVATDVNSAYWMGLNGFFVYDGVVRPLPCDVQDYVFNNINVLQRSKIFVARNSQYGELTWFYVSTNATEIDSYVTYNYFYKIWYFGTLSRTCWADRGAFTEPLAVGTDGYVYQHEAGWTANGASRNSNIFLQSGPAEIGNGDKIVYATQMIPDTDPGDTDAIQVRVKTKTAPMGRETDYGPFTFVTNAEGFVPVRVAGRQAAIRLEQLKDEQWAVGTIRFAEGAGGKR